MKTLAMTRLTQNEQNAINEAVQKLKERFPIQEIILFGSKARGDDDMNSDIDLLIVSDELLHWRDEKAIIDTLFDIGMQHDVIFSPLYVSKDEWRSDIFKQFHIYKEIQKDGALVQ